MMTTLIVTYLPRSASEADVREFFLKFGPIENVSLPRDPETNESRCFGFIKFAKPEHALSAMEACQAGQAVMRDTSKRNKAVSSRMVDMQESLEDGKRAVLWKKASRNSDPLWMRKEGCPHH